MAAFLANVGVNAAHAARSPLFDDGTFAVLPIPEQHRWRRPMVRLDSCPHLARQAPASWQQLAVHLDPDLSSEVPTYGDNCRTAGRAFSLRRAQPGDVIIFLARLENGKRAGFYLIGCLEIETAIADVRQDPGPGWWDGNAHIRRSRAIKRWDSFWVFKGTSHSHMFTRAIPFDKTESNQVFGDTWQWRDSRTNLQTIGSYTRAIRRVEGCGEEWLRTISRS